MAESSSGTGCLVLIALIVVLGAIQCSRDPDTSPEPQAYIPAPENVSIRADAAAQLTSLPGVIRAEWVDDEIWLSVMDNGTSWNSVAESACAWIRKKGMTGVFKAQVVDAAALSNKHVKQLGYAYCN